MVILVETATSLANPAIGVGEQSFPMSLLAGADMVTTGVVPKTYPLPPVILLMLVTSPKEFKVAVAVAVSALWRVFVDTVICGVVVQMTLFVSAVPITAPPTVNDETCVSVTWTPQLDDLQVGPEYVWDPICND